MMFTCLLAGIIFIVSQVMDLGMLPLQKLTTTPEASVALTMLDLVTQKEPLEKRCSQSPGLLQEEAGRKPRLLLCNTAR